MRLRPPRSTLFPYTTLFRSKREPRSLTYGSSGSGAPNALAVRIIEEASGARFLHVPYRGMGMALPALLAGQIHLDRKSTRLNSSHANISYAVFCLKKKTTYK